MALQQNPNVKIDKVKWVDKEKLQELALQFLKESGQLRDLPPDAKFWIQWNEKNPQRILEFIFGEYKPQP